MTAVSHMPTLGAVSTAAAVAGLLCLVALWWLRRSTGLPPSLGRVPEVVASDTGAAASVLLRDPVLGLRGRPDYVIEERTAAAGGDDVRLVPVEVKPSRRSGRLYENDALQLAAYLVAARATYGARAADHGYVRYASGTFRVVLSAELEARVRAVVATVRAGRTAPVVHRSHDVAARCRNCPVRERCDERLV